jgi:hypothetical protein
LRASTLSRLIGEGLQTEPVSGTSPGAGTGHESPRGLFRRLRAELGSCDYTNWTNWMKTVEGEAEGCGENSG